MLECGSLTSCLIICNSRFLNLLSCKTFLMATISPVSTTAAWNTTPKDPFPMIRSAEYEIVWSVLAFGLVGEWGACACEDEFEAAVLLSGAATVAVAAVDIFNDALSIFMIERRILGSLGLLCKKSFKTVDRNNWKNSFLCGRTERRNSMLDFQ